MRRILSVNTGLDVLYVGGGLLVAKSKGRDDDVWRGAGSGIVVQGAFLFFFDLFHAWQLRD
ncbi:MAG: hypothetical protein JW981_02505 [Anaerolineae bacterium]|nr:hypothetical protein [Anaerolineae bacterium]